MDLERRMGWRSGMASRIAGLPEGFDGLPGAMAAQGEGAVWHLLFVRDAAAIGAAAEFVAGYGRGQHLWIAYPKLTGLLRSDISRDRGWEPVTALGLLPVTQVAMDADWSALRFRFRDEIARLTRRF